MKVYKHGILDRYKEYLVTCGDCSCEFSYMINDLSAGVTYDSTEKKLIPYRFIRCPECYSLYLHPETTKESSYDEYGNEEL